MTKPDLVALFDACKQLLVPYAGKFKVSDRPGEHYMLDDESIRGHSVSFAAVVAKRGKVSFYLMPTGWPPALQASPALLAKRTKAAFFNFTAVEPVLFAELARLVAQAHASWDPATIIAT